jgi:hypothetical protein
LVTVVWPFSTPAWPFSPAARSACSAHQPATYAGARVGEGSLGRWRRVGWGLWASFSFPFLLFFSFYFLYFVNILIQISFTILIFPLFLSF